MNTQQAPIKHTAWIDICRLVAIFGVILIHVAGPVFNDYRSIPLDEFLIANAVDSLARVSVPLFALLSGALIIGRDTSINIIAKRIVRVAFPLVFWSFLYTFWIDSWSGKSIDFLGALGLMTQAPVMYHLWFVYMIIGVYMLLPILRIISAALISDPKLAIYFFALWLIVNSLTIYYPIKVIQLLNLSNFLGWPGYFILGHYLTRSKSMMSISAHLNLFVFLLASLSTFGISWHLSTLSHIPVITAFDYFSPNVVIASSAVFLWFQKIKVPDIFVKHIAFLSSMTFPVYFIHILIIAFLTGKNHGLALTPYFIHPAVGILGLSIMAFLTSITACALIRLLPNSSKIIG